ncbi:hypothetical protein BO99DRAFT_410810 [Aspergillus violaceofuscus CBS 115571]|uniref:Uncharacterized protein n=1 Tax=Aspergillus violaceofuscus (strain CBS 115571) TaxID=1450538 RepID=A0A2V5HB37_ASPV1|nr:hypothetical protein BO99DRAFT_410810 [Aspergillus violaceofuscus CBS 115571]
MVTMRCFNKATEYSQMTCKQSSTGKHDYTHTCNLVKDPSQLIVHYRRLGKSNCLASGSKKSFDCDYLPVDIPPFPLLHRLELVVVTLPLPLLQPPAPAFLPAQACNDYHRWISAHSLLSPAFTLGLLSMMTQSNSRPPATSVITQSDWNPTMMSSRDEAAPAVIFLGDFPLILIPPPFLTSYEAMTPRGRTRGPDDFSIWVGN